MNAIDRAMNRGNMVCVGKTYLVEFTQEPALDAFCYDVERSGGIVHEISDFETRQPDVTGRLRTIRRFSLLVTLPE